MTRLDATSPAVGGDRLGAHYSTLEMDFAVHPNANYEQLVVPNGNGAEPVHRWFRLKEAYSRRLLPRVLKDLELDDRSELRVLDPFAGSGTTAIAVADLVADRTLRRAQVLGYECNPFLHLVASTKLRALQRPTRTFLPLAQRLGAAAARRRVDPAPTPDLASFRNASFFQPDSLTQMLRLRSAIDQAEMAGAHKLDVDLARLCLGASIEPSSFLRRDGRALRFVPDKQPTNPVAEFLRRAEQIDDDLPRRGLPLTGAMKLGDGRQLRPGPPKPGSIDLVIFSPPYPNNIDYTEVYKLEAWLLGFISTQEQFREQRVRTLYSHPSIMRAPDNVTVDSAARPDQERALLAPLLEAVPDDRYQVARREMLTGYVRDMRQTLEACFTALKPGGNLVYVVGNSAHGSGAGTVIVAADLLIARLATHAGFDVQSIEVARRLRRRRIESEFLRESVVFAKRPGRS
jgi:DNA modification methylase